ncbi:MAG TPA: hypothetical protein VH573_22575 [Mycobacteriales bacterium]|jgi:hypothetical protein
MDPREPARAGAGRVAGADDDLAAGAEVEVHRPDEDDGSDMPWAAVSVLVLVLVTGAFASGWHFGRRWGRLMGW